MPPPVTHASGLIGRDISASSSPAIHEDAARALGTVLTYRTIDFTALGYADEHLGEVVRFLAGIGWTGCNVTHPFKQQVIAHCDELSEEARVLGAVNTLTFRKGRIIGHNTDWIGFSGLIERHIGSVAGARVAQIGAGGAGSATAYALGRLGVSELALFDPSSERAQQLVARLEPEFPDCRFVVCANAEQALAGRDGIVQTTPVGMAAHPGTPFDPALMKSSQWLADVIYFPDETELLGAARANAMLAVNGAAMVVGQAAAAFRLFTGQSPDENIMLHALLPAA